MINRNATCTLAVLVVVGVLASSAFLYAGGSPQEQRPRFRVDVDVVVIDMIASDTAGEFVDDLAVDEIVVYEDDTRQELIDFQLVDLRSGSMAVPSEGGVGDAVAADRRESLDGATARKGADVPAIGAMIFFVETPRLGLWARRRFAEAWSELAASMDTYAAPTALYVLDQCGAFREVVPLTAESGAMSDASLEVERLLRPVAGACVFAQTEDVEDWEAVRTIADRGDAEYSVAVLQALTVASAARRGRKSIVWVSSGIATTRGYLIDSSVSGQLDELMRVANSANTSIYAIDPTLVTERYRQRLSSDISRRIGPADEFLSDLNTRNDPMDSRVERFNALRDSLRVAARGTGGIAYPFTTRVVEAVEEIRRDSERYYLLTYPRDPDGDGEYREVRVETTRAGVTLRARSGYTDYPADELAARRMSADLRLPEVSDTRELPLAAYGSWADDGSPRLQLALDLGAWIDDAAAGDADRQLQLAVSAADQSGRIVDERYDLVTWKALGNTGQRPSVYVHDWLLPHGTYDVRVVLTDLATFRSGAGRRSVSFPAPESGWRISQPILLEAGRGGLPEAVVDPDTREGVLLGVYFEVWGDRAPRVNASLAGEIARVLPANVGRLGEGRFSVMASLRSIDPGTGGTIRVEVVDPSSGESRWIEVDF